MTVTHDADTTAEEIGEEVEAPAASTDIVQVTGVMMPFTPEEVSESMRAYQATVQATLDASDWQGLPGGRGSFVKKSGWRKIAKAFGLSVTRVDDGIERDPEGNPTRAWAVYRAAAPNGQTQDGDGYCSVDESRFTRSGGRQKLENDLRATATTRAKNRAISDLVGMGEVSAEEIAAAPPAAEAAFTGNLTPTKDALASIITEGTAHRLMEWIKSDNNGQIPVSVGRTLVAIGKAIETSSGTPAAEVPF